MSALFTLLKLALVLAVAFLATTRGVPWVWVRAGRLLGFRMKLMPVTEKRLARFKRIKRGYYSFLLITTLFVTSLFLELLVNSKPLYIRYEDRVAFPAVAQWFGKALPFLDIASFYRKADFGQAGKGEVDWNAFAALCDDPAPLREELATARAEVEAERAKLEPPGEGASKGKLLRYERALKKVERMQERVDELAKSEQVFTSGQAGIVQTIYPYAPDDLRLNLDKNPPNKPSLADHVPFGTDMSGRDVVPLLLYGFRISLSFALLVAFLGYCAGITVGAIQGYYGGWTDIVTQRVEEIWGSIPFLFTIMIIASMIQPTFGVLAVLLVVLRSWLGVTYYIRGEFYREKSKDYVQAAIGSGVSDIRVMLGHILPNSLVPVVSFAPFAIVAYIGSLVSLDYLGFGLPPGTPSWGALLRQGLENVKFYPHLTIVPVGALCVTLFCVVMIGEAVREAFDPKVFSRLR